MLKVLILALVTLSVADIVKAENICNSAVHPVTPVPVILPGPAGPPGPPGEKGDSGSQPGGAVYTRWGRTTCPTGATLVFTGRAAGADYLPAGGTSDTFCMPETPQYLSMDTAATHASTLHGLEFETFGDPSTTPFRNLLEHNMPCAVCHTDTKLAVFTIPAQYSCLSGWSLEYNGYLMSEYQQVDRLRKDTICVDRDAEAIPGLQADTDGAVVYLMKASCNGLPCPPYNSDMVLPCAVCSK